MNKQKKLILGVVIVAIILMAIGYASIQQTGLTITGSAVASENSENFKVYFTGEVTAKNPQDSEFVDVTVTPESTSATVDFLAGLDLDSAGDSAYAILQIKNGSNEINASSVNVTTNATDSGVFDFDAVMCNEAGEAIDDFSVESGDFTYVKVSVTLKSSPTEETNATMSVSLTAIPETTT